MSSGLTFPVLPGLNWSVVKTPIWKTKIQTAVSDRELRASYFTYPRWKFSLSFEVLRAAAAYSELQNLMAFFIKVRGSFDDFYYTDPFDYAAVDTQFGTGDGTTTVFPLTRPIYGFPDPVLANGTPIIKSDGVVVTPTITNGIAYSTVTFGSAPANGKVLTWTGSHYFRCRFLKDEADFENFMLDLWTLKKLEFISIK